MKNFIDSVVSLFLPYSFRIDSVFVSLNLLPLLMYKLHPQCICVEENRAGCHLLFQAAAEGLRVCPLHLSDDGQTSNRTCFLKQDMDFFSFASFTFNAKKLDYIIYITCRDVRIK